MCFGWQRETFVDNCIYPGWILLTSGMNTIPPATNNLSCMSPKLASATIHAASPCPTLLNNDTLLCIHMYTRSHYPFPAPAAPFTTRVSHDCLGECEGEGHLQSQEDVQPARLQLKGILLQPNLFHPHPR